MEPICYELQKESVIKPVPWLGWQDLADRCSANHEYWIELGAPTNDELAEKLHMLNLHPLIIEDCLSAEHATLIDRFPNAVYIELPTNASLEDDKVAYLSIICLPSMIITFRRGEIPLFPRLMSSLLEGAGLEFGNTADLLQRIINFFIEKTILQNLILRQRINHLEKILQVDLEDLGPRDFTDLKREVTWLESICEDQLYCARSLVKQSNVVIQTVGQEAYFDDLVSDAEHGLRSISRLIGRLNDLQVNFEMQHHDSAEKRLRILTIISAIFLPLTFITGYFGMNFSNAVLFKWDIGLFFFTFFMAIISAIMLWYFRSRGWFD